MNRTEEIIEASKTNKGSWTKARTTEWGVPWPRPSGWKKDLIKRDALKDHVPNADPLIDKTLSDFNRSNRTAEILNSYPNNAKNLRAWGIKEKVKGWRKDLIRRDALRDWEPEIEVIDKTPTIKKVFQEKKTPKPIILNETASIVSETRSLYGNISNTQLRAWGVDPKKQKAGLKRLIEKDLLSVRKKLDLHSLWNEILARAYEPSAEELNENYGYVYLITSVRTGRKYVGKHKQRTRKGQEQWRDYMGSGSLLETIYEEVGSLDGFRKTLLMWCENDTELAVKEAMCLIALGASKEKYFNIDIWSGERLLFDKPYGDGHEIFKVREVLKTEIAEIEKAYSTASARNEPYI